MIDYIESYLAYNKCQKSKSNKLFENRFERDGFFYYNYVKVFCCKKIFL